MLGSEEGWIFLSKLLCVINISPGSGLGISDTLMIILVQELEQQQKRVSKRLTSRVRSTFTGIPKFWFKVRVKS